MSARADGTKTASVLIVDGDIVSRHAIGEYLRHCGYSAVEAANTDEAMSSASGGILIYRRDLV